MIVSYCDHRPQGMGPARRKEAKEEGKDGGREGQNHLSVLMQTIST